MQPQNSIKVRWATLTIVRYPLWAVPAAFFSMALFRLPLMLYKPLRFWRLMGCGKNGTFDKVPDWKQWALLGIYDLNFGHRLASAPTHQSLLRQAYGKWIAGWLHIFGAQSHTYLLQPIEGHGLWNQKPVFGPLPKTSGYEGEIAVLTRATIRWKKLGRFWQHVEAAAQEMAQAPGFVKSYGIGEWPWVKQATFSIWQSKEAMRQFAYKSPHHKEVVRKTHSEQWYREEMFVRFKIVHQF